MKILVTGGAGYIGSHVVKKLKETGHETVVFDNLSAGHLEAITDSQFFLGDLANKDDLEKVFAQNTFDAVIHLAGSIEAGESMTNPQKFFNNNLICGLNLLETMLAHNLKRIVFSSSAAVYGEPEEMPLEEAAPKNPTNVYGLTKLMFEQILDTYDKAYGMKSVSLRYFNAAGADSSGEIGEDHAKETHLIPLAILNALGKKDGLKIFGTDYSTPDGTCLRDYIHVSDLAEAHILALNFLEKNNLSEKFNLGNEQGNSVLEVINVVKKTSGLDFPVEKTGKRDGDPARLYASSKKAREILGWQPKLSSIEKIIATAWNWHQKHPDGFKK